MSIENIPVIVVHTSVNKSFINSIPNTATTAAAMPAGIASTGAAIAAPIPTNPPMNKVPQGMSKSNIPSANPFAAAVMPSNTILPLSPNAFSIVPPSPNKSPSKPFTAVPSISWPDSSISASFPNNAVLNPNFLKLSTKVEIELKKLSIVACKVPSSTILAIDVEKSFTIVPADSKIPLSTNASCIIPRASRIAFSKVVNDSVVLSLKSCSSFALPKSRCATFIICGIVSKNSPIDGFASRSLSIICFCSAAVPLANPDKPSTLFSRAFCKIIGSAP